MSASTIQVPGVILSMWNAPLSSVTVSNTRSPCVALIVAPGIGWLSAFTTPLCARQSDESSAAKTKHTPTLRRKFTLSSALLGRRDCGTNLLLGQRNVARFSTATVSLQFHRAAGNGARIFGRELTLVAHVARDFERYFVAVDLAVRDLHVATAASRGSRQSRTILLQVERRRSALAVRVRFTNPLPRDVRCERHDAGNRQQRNQRENTFRHLCSVLPWTLRLNVAGCNDAQRQARGYSTPNLKINGNPLILRLLTAFRPRKLTQLLHFLPLGPLSSDLFAVIRWTSPIKEITWKLWAWSKPKDSSAPSKPPMP